MCIAQTRGLTKKMPKVNPEILVWARETAGLTKEQAAWKLEFQDSTLSSATEKLEAIENGQKEPSRPQLLKMARQYRRPLPRFTCPSRRNSQKGVQIFAVHPRTTFLAMRDCWTLWYGTFERDRVWCVRYWKTRMKQNFYHSLALIKWRMAGRRS